MLIILAFVQSALYQTNVAKNNLTSFYHNFSYFFFQDIYKENVSNITNLGDINTFRLYTQGVLEKGDIARIKVKETKQEIPMFGTNGYVVLDISYITRSLGTFTEGKKVYLSNNDGKWKVNWRWDLLLNGYKPGYQLISTKIPGKRGWVEGKNVAIDDVEGYLISVNPKQIDTTQEQEMLSIIAKVSAFKGVHIQNAYLENPMPNNAIPLVTNSFPLSKEMLTRIESFPGVSISSYPTRVFTNISPNMIRNTHFDECCTRIYSTTTYHGIYGVEKEKEGELAGSDGGKLELLNKEGKVTRTILEKQPVFGKDIML